LKVEAVGGLADATDKLRTRRYDVAVVDLDLPDDAGFALIDEIRRSARSLQVPVLGLSSRDLGATERERLSPPVVGLIRKGEDARGPLTASLRRALAARVIGPTTDGGLEAPPRDAKVLVVEDNEDNIFTLRQILAPLGLDVVTVSNGRDAIEYCRARLPDLILMDVQLPGMSGLQATGAIRKLPGGMTIPIVALTAQAMKGDRERILAAGCDDYLSKPVLPKTLLGVVQRYLAQRDRDAAQSASSASRHSTQRQSDQGTGHGTNPGRR
jgi:CheY-like chemotaxis protein